MNNNIYNRMAKGVAWIASLRILLLVFNFLSLFVLARCLDSFDFGLIGMGFVVVASVRPFTKIGVFSALVQKRKDINKFLDTAWTMGIVQSCIVYGVILFLNPYISDFFNAPYLRRVIPVLGLLLPLDAFANIGIVYFTKELRFKKISQYFLWGYLANFIVTVISAYLLRNFWAIVLGVLAEKTVCLIISYKMHPYRPRFIFQKEKARELFLFGRWVLFSSILFALLTQVDNFFIGKLANVAALGFYQMAFRISNLLPKEIIGIIPRVIFPGFAKLKGNLEQIRSLYLRVLQLVVAIISFFAGLLIFYPHELTRLFLGSKWSPIVPVLRIFSLFGLIRVVLITTHQVFLAMGKPAIRTKLQIMQLSLLTLLIYPFAGNWQISGIASAVTLSALLASIFSLFIINKMLLISKYAIVKIIMFPVLAAGFMGAVLLAVRQVWTVASFIGFGIFILVGLGIYIVGLLGFDKFFNYRIKEGVSIVFKCLSTEFSKKEGHCFKH
jgi:O-antigen/teichoic acid export membrane protein